VKRTCSFVDGTMRERQLMAAIDRDRRPLA
jgi:hypothetical protein